MEQSDTLPFFDDIGIGLDTPQGRDAHPVILIAIAIV